MSTYPYPQYGMMPQQPMPQQQMFTSPAPPQMPQAPGYTCKPVASREEALASSTDYLGLGAIMPDLVHEVIYLKRFNRDTGVSDFLEFYRCPPQMQPQAQAEYVTRTAFEEAMNSIADEINALKKRGKKATDSE